jgi:hypothetical protein
MYDDLVRLNRRIARDFFGERHGRTVSQMLGSDIDERFGLRRGSGKDLFHAGLVITLAIGLGVVVLAAG